MSIATAATTEIATYSDSQLHHDATVLAEAFYDDPMYIYGFPNPATRVAHVRFMMKIFIRYGKRYGTILRNGDPSSGVTVWLNPDNAYLTTARLLRFGLWKAPFVLPLKSILRVFQVASLCEHIHNAMPARHWYFCAVGVHPKHQGKGIGSKLINTMLENADRDSLPTYLETSHPRNVPLYERLGFKITHTQHVGSGKEAFTVWGMRREAQTKI